MKKGQIQFMETIFVLLVLIIIVFIGIVLFFTFFSRSISEKEEGFTEVDVVTLTDSILGMPEFTCGPISNSYCIDSLKVLIFNEVFNDNINYPDFDRGYYRKLFGNKRITLNITYPDPESSVTCTLTNNFDHEGYPLGTSTNPRGNCGNFIIYEPPTTSEFSQIYESATPVYFPSIEKKVLGTLKIEVFQEK